MPGRLHGAPSVSLLNPRSLVTKRVSRPSALLTLQPKPLTVLTASDRDSGASGLNDAEPVKPIPLGVRLDAAGSSACEFRVRRDDVAPKVNDRR